MFAKLAGLGLAATGIAHFIKPELFVAVTKPAFPEDTGGWIKRNGATETAIGAAIFVGPTRKLGLLGLLGYLGFLASRGAANVKS